MTRWYLLPATICLIIVKISLVSGHGRLMDPPARNAMWRYGFNTPKEYKDNFIYCGNRTALQGEGKESFGKCGVCGDHLWGKKGEEGAVTKNTQKIISRRYIMGQEMSVEVDLTANHWGRFEMYLCPNNEPQREVTQSCFNKYPLYVVGTQNDVQYVIPKNFRKWGVFQYKVQLPQNVTCSHCVVQWTYYGGRAWNKCPNGTEAIGCGEVDIFRNCADVAITEDKPGVVPLMQNFTFTPQESGQPSLVSSTMGSTNEKPSSPSSESSNASGVASGEDSSEMLPKLPTPVRAQVCISTPMFRKLFEADDWCMQKCMSYPPICPHNMCTCPDTCDAIGPMAGRAGADTWCQGHCINYPYTCHSDERCKCYKAQDETSLNTNSFNFEETNIFNYD